MNFLVTAFHCSALQTYRALVNCELVSAVENVETNLPEKQRNKALEVIAAAAKENTKLREVINNVHNEALQNLPGGRLQYFIRFDYGDKEEIKYD